jgi:hypothetical protein
MIYSTRVLVRREAASRAHDAPQGAAAWHIRAEEPPKSSFAHTDDKHVKCENTKYLNDVTPPPQRNSRPNAASTSRTLLSKSTSHMHTEREWITTEKRF